MQFSIECSAHNGVKPRDKLIDIIQIFETGSSYSLIIIYIYNLINIIN
jgi:hypothetical protein